MRAKTNLMIIIKNNAALLEIGFCTKSILSNFESQVQAESVRARVSLRKGVRYRVKR